VEQTTATDLGDTVVVPNSNTKGITSVIKNIRIHILESKPSQIYNKIVIKKEVRFFIVPQIIQEHSFVFLTQPLNWAFHQLLKISKRLSSVPN